MYEFTARVRYSETDEAGALRLLSMVNYLQDCSTFHSTDRGLTVGRLQELHRAWLLCYWDIYVDRLPALCEEIVIGTSPHTLKGLLAYRNFWIKDRSGAYLVRADSIWFLLDTEKVRPTRLENDILAPFGDFQDVLSLPRTSRRISLPEDMQDLGTLEVQHQHIDSNHHVNNAQYIALAAEAIAEAFPAQGDFQTGRIRAEYRKAARLGDRMRLYAGVSEGGRAVSLRDNEGEVYANVEIG